jgi:hypothetical protein
MIVFCESVLKRVVSETVLDYPLNEYFREHWQLYFCSSETAESFYLWRGRLYRNPDSANHHPALL